MKYEKRKDKYVFDKDGTYFALTIDQVDSMADCLAEIQKKDRPRRALIQTRVAELMEQYGGLRNAAEAVCCAPYTLARLRNDPEAMISDGLLDALGMRRVVTYERVKNKSK